MLLTPNSLGMGCPAEGPDAPATTAVSLAGTRDPSFAADSMRSFDLPPNEEAKQEDVGIADPFISAAASSDGGRRSNSFPP
jgi:hypothetical protein